jgi:SAM-dependent methyltransferase
MHDAARQWVSRHACQGCVLEIGSRNVNGSIRHLFGPDYTGLDIADGDGVDVVADVATWETDRRFDVVVCCEVLEHTDAPVIEAAHRLLRTGGTLILTAAGPGRQEHSAVDGGPLRPGEYYANVDPDDLRRQLAGWSSCEVDVANDDVRAVAVK